jgi:hypothetical protein
MPSQPTALDLHQHGVGQDAPGIGNAQRKGGLSAQQFRQPGAFVMRGGLGAGDGLALGDLVAGGQFAHRMARQQGAFEHAGQAIDFAFAHCGRRSRPPG